MTALSIICLNSGGTSPNDAKNFAHRGLLPEKSLSLISVSILARLGRGIGTTANLPELLTYGAGRINAAISQLDARSPWMVYGQSLRHSFVHGLPSAAISREENLCCSDNATECRDEL